MDPTELLIRQRYPQMIWALEQPELGPMLRQAVAEGWDPARLQGELLKTQWYRNTTDHERETDRLAAEDPATARTNFYNMVSKVDSMAKAMGVNITQEQLANLAKPADRSAWTDAQITQRLIELATYAPDQELKGQLNAAVDKIKSVANDYYAPVSDQAAFDMAKQVLGGSMDQASLNAYFKDLAVGRFKDNKQITDMLDKGFNAAQIFAPYIQQTASLLETSPASVNLMDPKYSQILDYNDNGTTRPMTLSEAGRFVRGTSDYRGTQGAVSQAADFAEFINQKMGAVA